MKNSLLIVFFALLLISAGGSSAYGLDEDPITVDSVEINGLRSIEEGELLYLLGLDPGVEISARDITEGIKRAFLKGIFNGLSVDSHDGRLIIDVDEKAILDVITVESRMIARDEVISMFGLKKGEYITDVQLREHAEKLQAAVRLKGFPEATVHVGMERLGPGGAVEAIIEVNEGAPVTIEKIVVIGRPFEELKQRIHLKAGDPYDTLVLNDDMASLRDYYLRRGYINPKIGPAEFVDGRLVLMVDAGQRLVYRISGNDSFPDRILIALMPFIDEAEVNDDLLAEAVERVVNFYKERGYSSVQVAPVIKMGDEKIEVRFYISEGRQIEVRDLRIIKDGQVSEDGVRQMLNNRAGNDYLPARLDDDVKIVTEFYVALGYRDASVKPATVAALDGYVDITIDVETGTGFTVGLIQVNGVQTISVEELKRVISVIPGDPYNYVDIADARRKMQALCRGKGYYECTVMASTEFDESQARLVFDVHEGPKFFFGKIIVSGNRKIDAGAIKRHIKFFEGDPLDMSKLVQARQRLYALGVFSRIEAEIADFHDHVADILITVEESKPGRVDFGIGYGEYEGFRSFIEIGYATLFGSTSSGSLRLEASSLWRRYILNYSVPFLMGSDIKSRTFLLREERKQKNIDTGEISYRIIKNAASTGIEKNLGRHYSTSLYYEYSIVDTYDVQPDIVLSREDSGSLAISSISPAIYYNTLNDTFDPSNGLLIGISLKDASKLLASESRFTKVTVQASAYERLASRIVGAISIRGGMAGGWGETTALPVVERFYLGGRNTVRGFDQDSIGPVSASNLPIGGNYFLLGNLEFRVRFARSWRTVFFGDCGNVWLNRSETSTGDLRCSAGMGLRYSTPVGPLRLDYGHKLDRREGESTGELHFSIGHAF